MNKLNKEQEQSIINKKNSGIRLRDIKYEFNIKTDKTIYDILKRNGRDKNIPNKKYSQNDNFFESIDNKDKSYWLGFIFADGYVRLKDNRSGELKIKLSVRDKEHLHVFKDAISSNSEIKFQKSKVNVDGKIHTSDCCILSIFSTKMVKDLFNLGCFSKKSKIIRFPNLREDLIPHFLRGYFDGDGCIYIRKGSGTLTITSNHDFLLDIRKILNYGKVSKRNINRGDISDLLVYHIDDIRKFYSMIYTESNIHLNRKKLKFEELFDFILYKNKI